MNCPNDGNELQFFSGDFPTGVESGGYKEMRYEEGLYCDHCGNVFYPDDFEPDGDARTDAELHGTTFPLNEVEAASFEYEIAHW